MMPEMSLLRLVVNICCTARSTFYEKVVILSFVSTLSLTENPKIQMIFKVYRSNTYRDSFFYERNKMQGQHANANFYGFIKP